MNGNGKVSPRPLTQVGEKKYVTLESASKISGYTTSYLERLCRLNQVDHLLWNKGGFVVEIESLLRVTHTALPASSDVAFVNAKELLPLPPQDPLPAVSAVADRQVGDVSDEFTKLLLSGVSDASATPSSSPSTPVYNDEWDELLLGATDDTKEESAKEPPQAVLPTSPLYETPSPYRPVRTSVDASLHHDPAPLLPPLKEKERLLSAAKPLDLLASSSPALSRSSASPGVPTVFSSMVPSVAEEHHPAIPETHALTKEEIKNIMPANKS